MCGVQEEEEELKRGRHSEPRKMGRLKLPDIESHCGHHPPPVFTADTAQGSGTLAQSLSLNT